MYTLRASSFLMHPRLRRGRDGVVLLLLAFTLGIGIPKVASSQSIIWDRSIGGNSNDYLQAVLETGDSGLILGGFSISGISGDKTEASWGLEDYWVVKLDSSGNVQWDNTIGGTGTDVLNAMGITSDGGYILAGHSNSPISGDKTENSLNGGMDYWIVKLNAAGVIEWQNTIGGSSGESAFSIQQTSDNGYICGGISGSNISGDKTENSRGGPDYWVVKLDSVGQVQWDKTLGGSMLEGSCIVRQTADGGYICGGQSESGITGDKTEISQGGYDYWILKLDASGNIVWQNTIGTDIDDEFDSVIQTSDGGYMVIGDTEGSNNGDKTEYPVGATDYWMVKLDAGGSIVFQNTIGGQSDDWAANNNCSAGCLIQSADDGYVIAGSSQSPISGDKSEQGFTLDFWIVKTNAAGLLEWENTITANSSENATNVLQTSDGNLVIGGFTSASIAFDKTENTNGSLDYWVLKVDGKYNLIQGKLFGDLNANGIQDVGEPPVANARASETVTGTLSSSSPTGDYIIAVDDTGSFTAVPLNTLPYYNVVPASHQAGFTAMLQVDSLNDFAFQPTGTFNDLCLSITPTTPFRSGFQGSYLINYRNVGTTTLNPTLVFYTDPNVTYVSSSPSAANVTTDSVVITLPPVDPFGNGTATVTVLVQTGIAIGSFLHSSATVFPLTGDADPVCNTDTSHVLITGSYDPNDMSVNRDSIYDFELLTPPWIEYLVRFQNTGNDTAFYVRVNAHKPAGLDLNTLEVVAASHPYSYRYFAYDSTFRFTFNNILLPDSTTNEALSHGFVRYRIKPYSSLSSGDSLRSRAAIYFDYNVPVNTNTVLTEIITLTSIGETPLSPMIVYPVPAGDQIHLQLSCAGLHTISIQNILGETVGTCRLLSPDPSQKTFRLDISELSPGVYIITDKNYPGTSVKFVKTGSR